MNSSSFFKLIASVNFFLILFSCSHAEKNTFSDPQIKAGVAKIYGKLNDPESKVTSLILQFQNPVTADESIIETKVDKDGSFYFEVPVECAVVFGSLYSFGYRGVLIELSSDKDINIELELDDSEERIRINNISGNALLTDEDKENYQDVFIRYVTFDFDIGQLFEMMPEEYAHFEMDMMKPRTDYAMTGAKFSEAGKNFTLNELKLIHLQGALLWYKGRMEKFFKNVEGFENWIQEPDIKYYTFLKSFDLNNPQYFCNYYYPETMQALLSVKALNIPPISETPVKEWIKEVKTTMAELVGFDKGLFYDMLAANSYARQFNSELKPLSDKQIENIKKYFKGKKGEIAKILLRKNEEIIKLAAQKAPLVVNKTPDISKEKLMDAIISKYKGKVIVVDFWATWCGPCIDAMKKYRTVKRELQGKNIIFVYLTNGSSPQKLWKEQIKGIGGEHYYLNADEWEYLMESFDFEGIPSYVIFDAQGKLRHKFTGYPGNEEMLNMIENLLP